MKRSTIGRIGIFGGLTILLPILVVVVWSYALRPRDVQVAAVDVVKIGDTRDLVLVVGDPRDSPGEKREIRNEPVLRVTFTAAQNFNTYDRHHDTGIHLYAYPCSWTTRDENNDNLFLSGSLYDRFGEVGLHEVPKGKLAATDKPPFSYHFYSSFRQTMGHRAYDLARHPEDVCFYMFGSANFFGSGYGQRTIFAPWYQSATYVIPKQVISDAITRAHIR